MILRRLKIEFQSEWVISYGDGVGSSPVKQFVDAMREVSELEKVNYLSFYGCVIEWNEEEISSQKVMQEIERIFKEILHIDENSGVINIIDMSPTGEDLVSSAPGLIVEESAPESDAPSGTSAGDLPTLFSEEEPSKPQTTVDESSFAWLNDRIRAYSKGDTVKSDVEHVKSTEPLTRVFSKITEMRHKLSEKIFGQQHAISAFTEGLFGIRVFSDREESRKGPKGIFLFAGPPGVGKTYLAETAAEVLDLPFLRVDMSEFSNDHAAEEFIGTDAIYKGSKPGRVTGFVDENPECVILFDEMEKAHVKTIQLFLQMLEGGRLRDVCLDKEISFRNTIIIMTTNAGRNLYEDTLQTNLSGITPKTVINALKTDINPYTQEPYFPTAIVSRLASGTIIMFNHLEPFALRDIVSKEIKDRVGLLEREYQLKINVDYAKVASAILYSEGGAADARTLKGSAAGFVRRELLGLFNQFREDTVKDDLAKLREIGITVDLQTAAADAANLFTNRRKQNVLVFCSEERKKLLDGYTSDLFQLTPISNLKRAQELLRGNIMCALIDVTCNTRKGTYEPSDLEDLDSDGVALFRYTREFLGEIPVFVLNTIGADEDRFLSLINSGARNVLAWEEGGEEELYKQVDVICENALMADSAYRLARASKVLTYNTLQHFDEEGAKAEIVLSSLALKHAVRAEDRSSLLDGTMRPNIRFTDVIGAKDAKESLQEFIGYLKDPMGYLSKGVRPPRGVLLYGPPGTGKTLLAKAMAGESDVAFIQKNGTEFFQGIVGEGPKAIRRLFATARRYAPAIIFVDEVDAFARMRTGSESGQFAAELLNTFLSEMDGFVYDEKRPVFVLVATNYEIDTGVGGGRTLDSAFVRRFDRKIRIELPNTDEREQFINYYLNRHGIKHISASAIHNLALRSYGKSPADLEMVVEFAIRNAKGKKLTDEILEKALDADTYGEENKWREETVRQITYHEAGHTIISWLAGKKPTYVTNISRGGFGGYMLPEIDDKKFGYSKREMLDEICCALGGRAAETVFYGEEGVSTGASGDLRNATDTARKMICSYGMDDTFVSFSSNEFGAEIETQLYRKINEILKGQYERAVRLLTENKDAVNALVDQLMAKNSLTADEIEAVLSPYRK